jgi:hypothetical protein
MSAAVRFTMILIILFVVPGLAYAGSAGLAVQCHIKLLDERVIAQYLGAEPGNTKEALIEIAKQQEFPAERMAHVMALIEEAVLQKDLGEWVRNKMSECVLQHHQKEQ